MIALRWGDVGTDSLTIDERYCRGDWGAPKSEASNATIGVEPCVIERIHRLKKLTVDVKAGLAVRHYKVVKSDRPEDLVFQSVKTGVAMRDNNILTRHIKPAARKLGLPWINWRCLRTSHATWMVEAGANPKDVQAQMRHSRISTTMDIYALRPVALRAPALRTFTLQLLLLTRKLPWPNFSRLLHYPVKRLWGIYTVGR